MFNIMIHNFQRKFRKIKMYMKNFRDYKQFHKSDNLLKIMKIPL